MDHSKMNHDSHDAKHHGDNPPMGMAGHDHHAMIADFYKRFYIVAVLTIPIVLLSTMIQQFFSRIVSVSGRCDSSQSQILYK
ncbi:MAG: hypothetical protein JJE09_05185 [Bacteroidia bacterium]|nr:hypothetical protein [Bacteroidia bacterium]